MTKYEALHQKFLTWNTAHDRCGEKAIIGMIQFFNGFCVYLDAPEDTVYLCRVDPDAHGLDKYKKETAGKALLQTDQNAWRFGIGIAFGAKGGIEMREVEGSRFSLSLRASSHLFFDIAIEAHEEGFTFSNMLDDKSPRASCKFTDPVSSMTDFYSYLSGILDQMFESKPWDKPTKIPIGFESTRLS